MRLPFVVVCMVGIGVGLVHFRKCESVARHELLTLETEYIRQRRTAQQQESDRGFLTSPRQIADRARSMDINPDYQPVRLAGPAERQRLQNTHRARN